MTFPEWLEHLARIPKGVNAMTLFPLSPIYAWVMGGFEASQGAPADRRPSWRQMAALLHEAMDLGAVGFSYQRCGPVSTQPDCDGSPMITDLLTDEEIIFFGARAGQARRGLHRDVRQAPDGAPDDRGVHGRARRRRRAGRSCATS